MKEIQGKAKTVRELLSGQRYSIDYRQLADHVWDPHQLMREAEGVKS